MSREKFTIRYIAGWNYVYYSNTRITDGFQLDSDAQEWIEDYLYNYELQYN
jgi:hypothetical protein